jgi:hypothetical protein
LIFSAAETETMDSASAAAIGKVRGFIRDSYMEAKKRMSTEVLYRRPDAIVWMETL